MAKQRRAHLQQYILPQFGRRALTTLNPVEVENWLISLPLSNQTKNHILYTLNIIMREAKREKKIKVNPISDVESLGVKHQARDILTSAELEKLFPRDEKTFLRIWPIPYYGVMYALLVSSGMRSGEIRALLWGEMDWQTGGVIIIRAVKADGTVGEPKSKASRRVVVLPGRTIELLQWWFNHSKYVESNQLVFPGPWGKPLSRRTVSVGLLPGLQRAGIGIGDRVLVVHSLRHTYNTRMKELLTGDILRAFTGHRTEKMSLHYDQPEFRKRLEQLGGVKPQVERFWD